MLIKSSLGLAKEGICRIRPHDRIAVNRKLSVYLGVSHNPDFFQIAPILLASSSGFHCVKILKNIFQYLL